MMSNFVNLKRKSILKNINIYKKQPRYTSFTSRRNIMKGITNEYISTCKYDQNNDTKCPVFLVDYILKEAEPDPGEQREMLQKVNCFKKLT